MSVHGGNGLGLERNLHFIAVQVWGRMGEARAVEDQHGGREKAEADHCRLLHTIPQLEDVHCGNHGDKRRDHRPGVCHRRKTGAGPPRVERGAKLDEVIGVGTRSRSCVRSSRGPARMGRSSHGDS